MSSPLPTPYPFVNIDIFPTDISRSKQMNTKYRQWRFLTVQPNIFEEFSLPSFVASAESRHEVAAKSAVMDG